MHLRPFLLVVGTVHSFFLEKPKRREKRVNFNKRKYEEVCGSACEALPSGSRNVAFIWVSLDHYSEFRE